MAKHAYQRFSGSFTPCGPGGQTGRNGSGDILSSIWGFFFLYLTIYMISA
jgi:hypothetical protein